MVKDKDFLKQEIEWGISADNPDFMNLAKITIDQISDPNISSVLDFGAGVGVYSEAARLKGFDVYAFDIWESHRNYISEKFPKVKIVDQPLTTDLLVFIEVAEHMTDEEVDQLFCLIEPKYILFSACNTTTENDLYWGHINIKENWHNFLSKYGYQILKKLDHPTDHTFLYGK